MNDMLIKFLSALILMIIFMFAIIKLTNTNIQVSSPAIYDGYYEERVFEKI